MAKNYSHFLQLPNKSASIDLVENELALKDGKIRFNLDGEQVLVTNQDLQTAIAGMSAPITVADKLSLDELTSDDVEKHQRVFVQDDGDTKWAYYMITDEGDVSTDTAPTYVKVSDEDVFGTLFSDNIEEQISKIGALDNDGNFTNLKTDTDVPAPATVIEAINTVYDKIVATDTRLGKNDDLATTKSDTFVDAINEIKANVVSNDGEITAIETNIGDIGTINLTDAADKENIVAALNKILAVQETKLEAEDLPPIILSYTGLLTDLNTTNENSLVEAINEVVSTVNTNEDQRVAVTGELANLVTEDKSNLVSAINEVHDDVVTEKDRAEQEETTLQSNIDAEKARAEGVEGDKSTLNTELKTDLVTAINEVHDEMNTETDRLDAKNTEQDTALENETTDREAADEAIQSELDKTQTGAGLENDGKYAADTTTNYIEDATSLKNADKKLDAQTKTNTDAISAEEERATDVESNIQSELDKTQTGAGLETDGKYAADETTNYITDATSLKNADKKLDTAVVGVDNRLTTVEDQVNGKIGDTDALSTDASDTIVDAINEVDTNTDDNTTAIADLQTYVDNQDNANQTELDATQTGAGLGEDGTYTADTTTNYIEDATSLKNADKKLDSRLKTAVDNLASEISRATGAEGSLSFDTALNVTETITNEDGSTTETTVTPEDLTDAINKEVARAVAVEGELDSKIDKSVSDLVDGAPELLDTMNELAAAINDDENFATTVMNDIAQAKTDLRDGASEAMDTMKEIEVAINTEKTERTSADSTINGRIDTLETQVTDSTQDIQDELDATQVGAGLGEDGVYTADSSTNYITDATSLKNADKKLDAQAKVNADAISAEEARATAAENTLQDNIDSEAQARQSGDDAIQASLNTETTDREAADADIQSELDKTQTGAGLETDGKYAADTATNYITDATSLKNADKKLDAQAKVNADAINAETERATDEEERIETKVDDEISRAKAYEGYSVGFNADLTVADGQGGTRVVENLTEAINAEYKKRKNDVSTLTTNLQDEIDRATAADGTLDSKIDNEIDRATDEEERIETKVDDEISRAKGVEGNLGNLNSDIADKTSLVGAINSVDSDLTSEASRLDTRIGTEEATRANEVSDLNDAITAEESTRSSKDGSMNFDSKIHTTSTDDEGNTVTTNPADLTTAINNEVSRATAKEAELEQLIADTESGIEGTIGDTEKLDTDASSTIVAAINEVQAEVESNDGDITDIKSFINNQILAKSGKTVDVSLVANTASSIDISDLASTNVNVSVYTVDGALMSQQYGMFVDVDTTNKTVEIVSSVDTTARIVITSDISGLSL